MSKSITDRLAELETEAEYATSAYTLAVSVKEKREKAVLTAIDACIAAYQRKEATSNSLANFRQSMGGN